MNGSPAAGDVASHDRVTASAGTDREAERFEVSSDLRVMCMRIARRVRSEAADELPHHLYSILAQLETGPLSPKALADLESVSPSFVGRSLAELSESGLITRSNDPGDGRRVIARLTDAGRDIIRSTRQNRDEWMASRVALLDPADFAVLKDATQILRRLEVS